MWVRNLSPWSVDCCSKDKSPYRNASLGFHFYLGIWKEIQKGGKAPREGFESLPADEEKISRMSFRHFRIVLQLLLCIFASAGHYAFCRMNLQRGWRSTRRPRSKFPETQMFTLCCTQMCFFCFIPYLPNSWPYFSRPQDYYSNGGGKEEAAKKRSWHKRKGDEVLQISMDDLPFFSRLST